MDKQCIIAELKKLVGETLPALNPARGGDSLITKVTDERVCFKRKKSPISVKIEDLCSAYQEMSKKDSSKWRQYFQKSCQCSFFLQLLARFDSVKVSGTGQRGSSFTVR